MEKCQPCWLSRVERGGGGRGTTHRFCVWWDNWGRRQWWPLLHVPPLATDNLFYLLCVQWSHIPFLHHFSFSTFSSDLHFTAMAATTKTNGSHIFVCSSAPSPKLRTYVTKTVSVSSPPRTLNPFFSSLAFSLVGGVAIFQVTHASGPWHHFLNVWSTGDF